MLAILPLLLLPAFALAAPVPFELPRSLGGRLERFEPSAAIHLSDIDRFLVASDDTDAKDSPFLFLLDRSGVIEEEPLRIEGVRTLSDVESLSESEGFLYVLSSQSRNKRGEEKPERNRFLRVRRDGRRLQVDAAVQLRPLLLSAILRSDDPSLLAIRDRVDRDLDVESHFVRSGHLFVGLKTPQPRPGVALVLDLGAVEALFQRKILPRAEVFARITLGGPDDSPYRLSDLVPFGDVLFMAATRARGPGVLLTGKPGDFGAVPFARYAVERPEGIARDPRGGWFAVFDQGADGGLFERIPDAPLSTVRSPLR